jgi:hypothetical protein
VITLGIVIFVNLALEVESDAESLGFFKANEILYLEPKMGRVPHIIHLLSEE